jgi:uncharacterized membrane protein YfcA
MALSELDLSAILLIGFAYLLAGVAKGGVGFGLPLIAVPLVASIMPVPVAVALTFAPILISNIHQAATVARPASVLRRFWPLIGCMVVGTALGAQILTRVDRDAISVTVGILLLGFVASRGLAARLDVPRRAERWLSPAVGLASGLLGGVSGMLGPLFLIYLVALRLSRDAFVGTISVFYLLGILPLYITLFASGVIARNVVIVSLLACVPLFVGIWAGTWLRGRVSQAGFMRLLLAMICLVGLNLIRLGFS